MKEVRVIPEEKLQKRRENNTKILKFGCLPIFLIASILILFSIFSTDNKKNAIDSKVIQDFCLNTMESIIQDYGKPSVNNTWYLKNSNVAVELFEPLKPERNVTFYNIEISPSTLASSTGFTAGSVQDLGGGIYKLNFSAGTNSVLNVRYRENDKQLIINISR